MWGPDSPSGHGRVGTGSSVSAVTPHWARRFLGWSQTRAVRTGLARWLRRQRPDRPAAGRFLGGTHCMRGTEATGTSVTWHCSSRHRSPWSPQPVSPRPVSPQLAVTAARVTAASVTAARGHRSPCHCSSWSAWPVVTAARGHCSPCHRGPCHRFAAWGPGVPRLCAPRPQAPPLLQTRLLRSEPRLVSPLSRPSLASLSLR